MNNLFSIGDRGNELHLRIKNALYNQLERLVRRERREVGGFLYTECDYKSGSAMPDVAKMRPFAENERWGGRRDAHAWFYKRVDFPETDLRVELRVETQLGGWDATNPQFMLYIDGVLKQGMDVNHRSAVITERGEHDVFIYAYSGTGVTKLLDFFCSVELIDEDVERLYYNLRIPCEVLEYTPLGSEDYYKTLYPLNEALNLLDMRDTSSDCFRASVRAANEYLESEYYGKVCREGGQRVACFGHTHIDLAWLWSFRQTVEKAQRSFATVVALMERYPDYRFMSSQPPLYEAVKREDPVLYEKIKALVAEGRWEPEGGMYVEADTNLTSGESLVRQLLYGKRFFREEFGIDSKVVWMPDVFGYSAALPQIMNKCGITDFVTSKISWNDVNDMPYDLFKWRGIDGSETATHFITSQDCTLEKRVSTYVCVARPSLIKGTYDRLKNKNIFSEGITTIGWGDGGGGTTPYDCESIERQKHGIPGQPTADWRSLAEYMNESRAAVLSNKYTPTWQGELYLECHRGTYTSQAQVKWYNRKNELALQASECATVLASEGTGFKLEKSAHDEAWKTLLLNQFHDILPGSSIAEVYEVTKAQHEQINRYAVGLTDRALGKLAQGVKSKGLLVFNPCGYDFTGFVSVDGERLYVEDIPAKGYAVVTPKRVGRVGKYGERCLENGRFKLSFDEDMNIASIIDKAQGGRELLIEGRAVRFVLHEDTPLENDAWEVPMFYREKKYGVDGICGIEAVEDSGRVGVRVTRRFGESQILDTVWLLEDKIEFENEIDWHESYHMLKREFPIDITADKASCEIQFGYVDRATHRNTSWDYAKFEVCAHRFVDLSEGDYGVALLNDSKYGHCLLDGGISITLLRSPKYPDPNCDMGKHKTVYALYPHKGSLAVSDVVKKAHEFNNPCYAVYTEGGGCLPDRHAPLTLEGSNLIIDTLKPAEDGNGIVARAYEPYRTRGVSNLRLAEALCGKRVFLCDMLENELEELSVNNGSVEIPYLPFEIITLKVR